MARRETEFRSKRVTPADVLRHYVICQMLNSGMSQQKVADVFGVSRQAILYQVRQYGQFPFNPVLDRLQLLREKYRKQDPQLAQVLIQAAECIVNLEQSLKRDIEEVLSQTKVNLAKEETEIPIVEDPLDHLPPPEKREQELITIDDF
jgi:predicted transcriptional regulator